MDDELIRELGDIITAAGLAVNHIPKYGVTLDVKNRVKDMQTALDRIKEIVGEDD